MIEKLKANKKALIAICGVAIAGIYWYSNQDQTSDTQFTYQTSPITQGKIESIVNTAGTLSPVVTVEVGSEISGLVSELNADFNSEVKSGEVIARIDDRTVRSRLKQSEANLASSKASLEQTKANLAKAQADLKLAETELKRQNDLRQRQLNSQVDLDGAIASAENARASVAVSRAQVISAEAQILQSEATLEQSQLDLERTIIRSPVDGTVIDRQVDIGQTVAASLSAPTLFQIAQDLTKMQIEADVDEADIGKISEGLTARFSVDAYPDSSFDGVVTQVRKASTITNNVVTYKVIITADNSRQRLLPGMTANVDIILGVKEDVLRVANGALRFNPPEGVGVQAEENNTNSQLEEAIKALGLTAAQTKQVEEVVAEMQTAMQEAREAASGGFGGGGGDRGSLNAIRQSATNKLQAVLNAEQLAAVQTAMRGNRGGGQGRGQGGQGFTRAQVWVLEDEQPRAIRIRAGLSDDQFTEIESDDLNDGDEVIVRISRSAQ